LADTITASITNESAEELQLAAGKIAKAYQGKERAGGHRLRAIPPNNG
jgi:hypothetical protein